MITLGINAAYHDSAAALVRDGELVAASEEERFTRIKHAKRPVPFSAWELPFHAIDDCLRAAGITLADVDHVGYSFDPEAFLHGRRLPGDPRHVALPLAPGRFAGTGALVEPVAPAASVARAAGGIAGPLDRAGPADGWQSWDNPWDPLVYAYVRNAADMLVDGAPHHLRRRLQPAGRTPRFAWHPVDHHLCHQASAFLAGPFDAAAVMTLDGRGETATTTYGHWRDGRYRPLGAVHMPHSLGLLYEGVTKHLGFLGSSDEYKVMALAALGRPRLREALRDRIQVAPDGRYTIAPFAMTELFGAPRGLDEPVGQRHLDIAASLQQVLEEVVLELAGWIARATGERHLAMAGGVALNCLANARVRDSGLFDGVWVQPAAGDAGTALGAALWVDGCLRGGALPETAPGAVTLGERHWTMTHAYWGPGYDDAQVAEALRFARLPDEPAPDLVEACVQRLAAQQLLGWFQGRMEFGPRALGARSILASPTDPAMQQRLNALKDREDFRPVAPVVPQEDLADWFEPAEANGGASPFMLFTCRVRPDRAARIPSALHVDGTARVQTVTAASNPLLHRLLRRFGERTGVPVLVNTSFNVRGEPIVATPRAALEAFWSTPLDALAIGSFLLAKGAWT